MHQAYCKTIFPSKKTKRSSSLSFSLPSLSSIHMYTHSLAFLIPSKPHCIHLPHRITQFGGSKSPFYKQQNRSLRRIFSNVIHRSRWKAGERQWTKQAASQVSQLPLWPTSWQGGIGYSSLKSQFVFQVHTALSFCSFSTLGDPQHITDCASLIPCPLTVAGPLTVQEIGQEHRQSKSALFLSSWHSKVYDISYTHLNYSIFPTTFPSENLRKPICPSRPLALSAFLCKTPLTVSTAECYPCLNKAIKIENLHLQQLLAIERGIYFTALLCISQSE